MSEYDRQAYLPTYLPPDFFAPRPDYFDGMVIQTPNTPPLTQQTVPFNGLTKLFHHLLSPQRSVSSLMSSGF